MAQLSGHLTADFSSFTRAVDESVIKLRGFEGDAAKVGTALNRMGDALSGRKLIQDATLMAEAVEQIGGASKLTDKELQRLGATATEAVEKMRRIGVEVPPGLQSIADQANKATQATFDWRSALLSTAGTLGIAFSVNTLKNFALGVIETAGTIGDMAEKLGVSAEAVQRWGYAAEQSGASMETVDSAIKKMNANLAGGSNSTVDALAAAGLEFETIRNMSPETAFETIADAIAGIEDPMLRAKVATELFGKAGQEMLPTFLAGLEKVGSATRVMSDETIARLKAAEDAWRRLSNVVTIVGGEIIAETFRIGESWKDFMIGMAVPSFLRDKWREVMQDLGTTGLQAASDLGAMAAVAEGALPKVASGLKPVALNAEQAAAEIGYMNATITTAPAAIALVEPKLGTLAEATRHMARGTDELAASTEALNTQFRFTSEVVDQLPAKMTAATQAMAAAPVGGGINRPGSGVGGPPGSVQFDMGNVSYGSLGFAAVFEEYLKKAASGSGMLGGFVGGGPPKDFLTWALSMGLATRAPTVTNTFNIVDTESGIARRVGDTITSQMQRGSLVN